MNEIKASSLSEESNPLFIPFCRHSVEEDEAAEILDTLKSDWLTTGPKTRQFEKDFAEYIGAAHAIAVNSCTSALHLSLLVSDVGPGDEVITTPLTFCATVEAIEYCGAKTVFVDVDGRSFNIDAQQIEEKITPRTKCILPVHYGGIPCDLDSIYRIAEKHELHIVEDAAHALGTAYKFKKIGQSGPPACFSFYPVKNITTGEGGMIALNDDTQAQKIRTLSLHGMSRDAWQRYSRHGSWYYEIHHLGYKYNFSDIQASLGLCQLKKLERFNQAREKQAEMYIEALQDCPGISFPEWYTDYFLKLKAEGFRNSWHLFIIMLDRDRVTLTRDALIEELGRQGIGTSVHFIPLHLQPYYAQKNQLRRGDFPVAESIFDRIISLPIYPRLKENELYYITDTLKRILGKHKK